MRHILDVEDQDWLLKPEVWSAVWFEHNQTPCQVSRGLRVLEEEGKVFDCLVRPPTLQHVATIGQH